MIGYEQQVTSYFSQQTPEQGLSVLKEGLVMTNLKYKQGSIPQESTFYFDLQIRLRKKDAN